MSIWEQAKLAESVLKVQVKLKCYMKRDEIAETRTDHSLPAQLNTRSKAHKRGSDILVC